MSRSLTAPGPVGGCSLVAMTLVGLLVEWRRYEAGAWDPWFPAALALGALLGFGALATQGRLHAWALRASLYLLFGTPVLLFAMTTAAAAGWF